MKEHTRTKTYEFARVGRRRLSCDICGALVSADYSTRLLHARWHLKRDECADRPNNPSRSYEYSIVLHVEAT